MVWVSLKIRQPQSLAAARLRPLSTYYRLFYAALLLYVLCSMWPAKIWLTASLQKTE